ncbi:EamA-like transporter family protein [Palleronia marisminoris]|uniref:Putative inner membrane transporter YedA n=1 Tax=Palleronia marisminoris TaxID=315423 RepID=A0A1Y5SF45_9RHOB|nr:DMT family transporter [Palleronia marisminoris]SFG79902.1 EamA-like transporter family protein [Palleronia marisminoris]SLN39242.1 putative inner membrane transporter YedA [Palleronia marisminoris]
MTDRPTPENWLSILFLGLIWGGTFMIVSIALRGYGPLTVACARTTLGAAALLMLMAVMGRRFPREPRIWAFAVPIGIANTALPFFLLSWGQQYVPSAFAGLSMAALPLFVLPLAHVFSDEPMSLRRAFGVSLGFSGAALLLGPGALAFETGGTEALGRIACLTAAVSYAAGSILTRRCPPVDAITLSALTLVVGAVVLIPAMLLVEGVPRLSGSLADPAIVVLGLIPTALAVLIRVRVVQTAGSVFMTLVNYQVPVWSMIFGAAVLGEALPLRFFAALALILAGLAVSQWNSLRGLVR